MYRLYLCMKTMFPDSLFNVFSIRNIRKFYIGFTNCTLTIRVDK
nr:MAG TPA_asm: hypothetical protein [Caudoviricetes sp.]